LAAASKPRFSHCKNFPSQILLELFFFGGLFGEPPVFFLEEFVICKIAHYTGVFLAGGRWKEDQDLGRQMGA
jgi:hypothetical protein